MAAESSVSASYVWGADAKHPRGSGQVWRERDTAATGGGRGGVRGHFFLLPAQRELISPLSQRFLPSPQESHTLSDSRPDEPLCKSGKRRAELRGPTRGQAHVSRFRLPLIRPLLPGAPEGLRLLFVYLHIVHSLLF